MTMKIENIIQKIKSDTGFTPIMAAELEFYSGDETLETIREKLRQNKIPVIKIEREKGLSQFEIALPPTSDIAALAGNIARAKEVISGDFSAKPDENQPGSGLHIHLSLHDKSGKNIFAKAGDAEALEMLYAIGGLLAVLPESMIYFAPNADSYKRFTANYHAACETYDNAPTKICWGGNNRTAAIRIPESTASPENRHIEHRVPGADADPFAAIAAILAGAHYGLMNQINPPEKIYGNAYEPQYKSAKLPGNLAEAERLSREGSILKN